MGRKVMRMGRTVAGPTGSWRRRWVSLLSLVVIVGAALIFVRTVLAVHDTGAFELEGNAVDDLVAGDDWANVFNETDSADVASFTSDGDLNATIFTGGGSKDPQDVSSWAWKDGAGGLPDKDNLLHSFAARYSLTGTEAGGTCPNGTGDLDGDDVITPPEVPFDATVPCVVLFFGSDRFANDGDAQQGFWFLQNPTGTHYDSDDDGVVDSPCPITIGGGTGFCDPTTGLAATHRDGDLLIISNFSNGGEVSTISIFVWDDSVNGNLVLLQTSTAANCGTAAPGDAFCGIVNPNDDTTSPWPFLDKVGSTSFRKGEFFEGGVNLSLLGLADECFASASSETRSSTSVTAVLKDFVLGQFAACTSGLVTTPVPNTNVVPGATVGDSAVLTIAGTSTWSGTMKFFLCDPDDLVSQTTCVTGGTQIGSDIAVDQDTTQPILSATTTVSTVGKYCWRGEFISSTQGVPDATDASAGECFNVIQLQPTISTAQTFTVQDSATITVAAGAGNLAGSVRFRLYNNATCTPGAGDVNELADQTVAVSGTSPQTVSTSVITLSTPANQTTALTLAWLVEYTSTNGGHANVTSSCNTERATLTVVNQ